MSDTTLNLTPDLYEYLKDHSLREHPVLKKCREHTHSMSMSQMQISPEQGQFMGLLVQLLNARKTLEVGVFTGYSTLAVALALPDDGKVVACDINPEWTKLAKSYWKMANVEHKIDLHLAPALQTLNQLIDQGEAESFDFAFIDADKANYVSYYEKSLQLVRPGGLIAIDNVLWDGKVVDPSIVDPNTLAIRALNTHLAKDDRISISMLAIGDGLTLARKK